MEDMSAPARRLARPDKRHYTFARYRPIGSLDRVAARRRRSFNALI
jgi:hypothetical protein